MKILLFIDSLGSGGAQRQLVGLSLGFKEKGHDVTFLTYHSNNFFKPFLIENEISLKTIVETNPIKRLFKIRLFIRKNKPDAILSFLETPSFISEIAGFPKKKWILIVGERDADPQIPKSLKLRFYRLFHIFADFVVANSNENIKLVRQANPLIKADKCKVIYNMVDLKKWTPLKTYLPGKNKKFKIIVSASHQYKKNLIGLVNALILLTKQERDYLSIDWYGDKVIEPYVDQSLPLALAKIYENGINGVINFYPATSQILEIVQQADAVALFSFYEGLPNAICEGMSLGKPIILSNVSDNSNLVYENKGGFLFNPKEPESIAGAIRKLINLSNEELVKFGNFNRKRATELFDKTAIVNEYLKTFSLR
jgi:glycosyltransferase involved in cell wall biosynthesis